MQNVRNFSYRRRTPLQFIIGRGISFIAGVSAVTVNCKQRKIQMGKEVCTLSFFTGLTTIDSGGQMKDVLDILGSIEEPRINADFDLYEHLLKKYVNRKDPVKGKCLHGHVIKAGFESDGTLGVGLIGKPLIFSVKCRGMASGQQHLPSPAFSRLALI